MEVPKTNSNKNLKVVAEVVAKVDLKAEACRRQKRAGNVEETAPKLYAGSAFYGKKRSTRLAETVGKRSEDLGLSVDEMFNRYVSCGQFRRFPISGVNSGGSI